MPATEGECGNQLASAQRMGVGVKDEVNVLEPNNQHADVFTLWPSSMGGCRTEQVSGPYGSSGQGHTAPSCWMSLLLKITR